jgi:tetratricopeptide (TPR) repeat protein
MSRRMQALLALLLLGVVKLPMEQAVSARLKEARLLDSVVDLGLWENLGQMGFAASLGGLRSLVATVTYMQAYLAFEDIEWARVDSLFQLTSRLQPRDVSYWDEASWHMAYNAASHYINSQSVEPVMRGKLYHGHIQRGVDILEEGLKFNPDNIRLLARLGDIYARRKLEPIEAAKHYLRVFELGGPPLYERLAAYQYMNASDRDSWLTAYKMLRKFYESGQKFPTVIDGLKDMEQKLQIPPFQRIPDAPSGRTEGLGKPPSVLPSK